MKLKQKAWKVKVSVAFVFPAEDVQRNQSQPGQLDDQHDDDEVAVHPGAHPSHTRADPNLHCKHTGKEPFSQQPLIS